MWRSELQRAPWPPAHRATWSACRGVRWWLPSGWPEADRRLPRRSGRAGRGGGGLRARRDGLYRDASLELQAILLRAYGGDSVLDPMEAQRAQVQVRTVWTAGGRLERRTALLPASCAAGGGQRERDPDQPVDTSWRVQADDYHKQAMAYLVQPVDLVNTLQAQAAQDRERRHAGHARSH